MVTLAQGLPIVLIVENEYLVAAPSIELLRDEGITVLHSTNGHDGLKLLGGNPQISIVAVDIGLPHMNGNEFLRQARSSRPLLNALIVTGYDPSVIEIPEDERTRYLPKPYMPEDFLRHINWFVENGLT